MHARRSHIDRRLAEWVLGRITPEDAVALATTALEHGCHSVSVAIIAGLRATERDYIESELQRLTQEISTTLPSEAAALKTLVDDCAWRIANHETDPVQGGWAIWQFEANEDESAQFSGQVRRFVDLASECDNAGPHVEQLREELVAEADAFLRRGGLRMES